MATQIKISELPLANESALSLAADDRFIFNNDNVNTQTIKFANLVDAICEQNLKFTGNCQFTQSIVGPDGGDLNNGLDDMNDVQLQNVQSGQLLQYSGTQWINIDSTDLDQDLSDYAKLESPVFTGTPQAPTAGTVVNTSQIATTGYVYNHYAPKASPMFEGVPTAPTATPGNNTTQIATTAFVNAAVNGLDVDDESKASNALVGVPNGSTTLGTFQKPSGYPGATNIVSDNATVKAAIQALNDDLYTYKDTNDTALDAKAPLESPIFTGTPQAATPDAADVSTRIATTEYVSAALAADGGLDAADLSVVNGVASGGGALTYNDNGVFTYQAADLAAYALTAVTYTKTEVDDAMAALLVDTALTGSPTAPTVGDTNDSSTAIATTAFVSGAVAAGTAPPALRVALGIKSGANQGAAGAATGELWYDETNTIYVVGV